MILKLADIHTFQILAFMYQTKHDLLPRTCLYSIPNTSIVHIIFESINILYLVPAVLLCERNMHRMPVPMHGISLPGSIKQSESLYNLKSRLKLYFVNLYN